MDVKASGQFPRARQALAGRQVVAQNAEYHLSHKLFANADFASARKP
jgi:hypothetical protein